MICRFRDLFSSELSDDEKIQIKELKEKSIKEKWCTSCIYYSCNDCYPGFVDYRGDCKWDYAPCCDATDDCDKYELDPDEITKYKNHCKEYGLEIDEDTMMCSNSYAMKKVGESCIKGYEQGLKEVNLGKVNVIVSTNRETGEEIWQAPEGKVRAWVVEDREE